LGQAVKYAEGGVVADAEVDSVWCDGVYGKTLDVAVADEEDWIWGKVLVDTFVEGYSLVECLGQLHRLILGLIFVEYCGCG